MMNEENGTPLDSIIETIQSYIKNPKLVTRETLQELLFDIEDLRDSMKEDYSEDDEEVDSEENSQHRGGLTILIGKSMKGGGEHK